MRKIELTNIHDTHYTLATNVETYDNYFMYTYNRVPKLPLTVNSVDNIIPVKQRDLDQPQWRVLPLVDNILKQQSIFEHKKGYEFKAASTLLNAHYVEIEVPIIAGSTYGFAFQLDFFIPNCTFQTASRRVRLDGMLVNRTQSSKYTQKVVGAVEHDINTKTSLPVSAYVGNITSSSVTDLQDGWFRLFVSIKGDSTGTSNNAILRFWPGCTNNGNIPANSKVTVRNPQIIKNPFMSDFDDYDYTVNVILLKEMFYEDPDTSYPQNPSFGKGNIIAISKKLTNIAGIESYIRNFENLSKFIMQIPSNTVALKALEDTIKTQSYIYTRRKPKVT